MAGREGEDQEPVGGYEVVLRPEAAGDMEGAYDYYEAKSPGLGAEFLNAVDACLASV